MTQGLAAQTAKVVLEKVIQFPGQLRFVKSQAAGDRIASEGGWRRSLNLRNDLDRCFQQSLAFFIRRRFKNLKQLPVAEIFLHDDSGGAVDVVNSGNWQPAFKEQPRDIEVGMNRRIERFGIHGGDGVTAFPGNAKVLSRRSV